jgi:hypothetical protein
MKVREGHAFIRITPSGPWLDVVPIFVRNRLCFFIAPHD